MTSDFHFQQHGPLHLQEGPPAIEQRDPESDEVPNTWLDLLKEEKPLSLLLPSPSHEQNLTGSGEQQQRNMEGFPQK